MIELKISVVVPVYNEQGTIAACLKDIIDTLSQANLSFEIVAVNDGSRDGSQKVMLDLLEQYPDYLRVVDHVKNKGYGAALRTGIRMARGEIVVCMDGDGQHKAADILKVID